MVQRRNALLPLMLLCAAGILVLLLAAVPSNLAGATSAIVVPGRRTHRNLQSPFWWRTESRIPMTRFHIARPAMAETVSEGLPVLSGQVALVTGASCGIGKGCALALAKAGCTVYITGRMPNASASPASTLMQTAAEITHTAAQTKNGGRCTGIFCDHTSCAETEAVFEKIDTEHGGRLDVVVSNAYDATNGICKEGLYWWDRESIEHWDVATNVGLRGHYMCALMASRRMSNNGRGLFVAISGPGGMHPEAKGIDGVSYRPAHRSIPYVVAKSATDRIIFDMASDLKSVGVTAVSLWPGGTMTERILSFIDEAVMKATGRFESLEFTGRAVVAMAGDGNIINKAGKVVMPHELACEYGFTDVSGCVPKDALNILPLRDEMASPPPNWVPNWDGYRRPEP